MRSLLLFLLLAALPASSRLAHQKSFAENRPPTTSAITSTTSGSATITGQAAGATPFIAFISMVVSPADSLKNVRFTISPKPGSVTRPVSAVYTFDYLQSRGYYNSTNGQLMVPVFGLYAGYSNTVSLTCGFADGTSQQQMASVITAAYTPGDTCGYTTPTVLQARTNSTSLSYDYIFLRVNCGTHSPVIIDTDGAIRWIGITGTVTLSSMFFDNAVYLESTPANPSSTSGITRTEFDGTFSFIHDYSDISVTDTGHHNYDPGKRGMLVEVDTTTQQESVIIEIDPCGKVLKTWNLANIISAAITAGGENPTTFVRTIQDPVPPPHDWFHSNAATYRASDDTLIVSSRENFVIALDYETGAIKWILGDTTKQWYQSFQSLRQYALTLGPNTLPPIGGHAVSITKDDDLLCFDNGRNSLNHTPAGIDRTYSAPRKYHIDTQAKVATEVWNYERNQTARSQFCSSVYEDAPLNYLIDYAQLESPPPANAPEILGLDASGNIIFDYRFAATGCNTAWNAIPIHFENMRFNGPDPLLAPGGWKISSVSRNGSNVFIRFPAMAGKNYRVEYKNALSDPTWQTVGDVSATCNGTSDITDSTASGSQRFYHVRLLP
jgi:arylsulfate sulfotransferase